ncbi:hypothetical protein CDD81_4827 [Ophiocordyceps australis]|uniref:Uncharacterized protein n=1 Tax=Ophiocordyceps australis TaxID=1399860 RepID=A0A2C5Y9B1_9HYPO|nr:hypothetical protein CDD81_4827 [Ophiocordyceps australis]
MPVYLDIYRPEQVTSTWLYNCGHVAAKIKTLPQELSMTSTSTQSDALARHEQEIDWGAYVLNILPPQLLEKNLGEEQIASLRSSINLESRQEKSRYLLSRFAGWMFDRREAKQALCWPRFATFDFVDCFGSMVRGLFNLFVDSSLFKKRASAVTIGFGDAEMVPGPITTQRPLCLFNDSVYHVDISTALADLERKLNGYKYATPETGIDLIKQTLLAYQHPFLKALGEAAQVNMHCTYQAGCVDFLLYGRVYAPRNCIELVGTVRNALTNRLPVCLVHNQSIPLRDSITYINLGTEGSQSCSVDASSTCIDSSS